VCNLRTNAACKCTDGESKSGEEQHLPLFIFFENIYDVEIYKIFVYWSIADLSTEPSDEKDPSVFHTGLYRTFEEFHGINFQK
jgi:hypothetical protein